MTLPQTYIAALVLTILSMLCWGSWANTFKMTGNWRFELFYFDYALGVLLAAVIAALTFGAMGSDGFQFMDDLLQTGKRNIFYGFLGGVVFNLANMLLVAAISVAGMAVAFPVGIGMALVIGVIWNYIIKPQGNPVLLFGGAAIIVAAIIVDALAYKSHAAAKLEQRARAGMLKTSSPSVSPKGIILSLVSGVLMGSFFPLVEMGKAYAAGLGPYAIGFVFALGVFLSTLVFNLFFMNLPVQGEPVEILDYIRRGNFKRHLLGVIGGMIWFAGAISNFVAASAEQNAKVGPAVSYAIGQGATMVSALWGLFLWKEFEGADFRVKILLYLMLALFIIGLGMVSLAPLYMR
jgi:glucose uptake protein